MPGFGGTLGKLPALWALGTLIVVRVGERSCDWLDRPLARKMQNGLALVTHQRVRGTFTAPTWGAAESLAARGAGQRADVMEILQA